MADQTFFQHLVGEVVDFLEYMAAMLGEDLSRDAVIRDLGGNPSAAVGQLVFPPPPLDSIKTYRDAANPTAEADAAVLADVVAALDLIANNIEAWATKEPVAAADEFVQSLIDLMATNYVRLRWPRFFLIMQSVATLDDLTSTYGAGSNSVEGLGNSLKTFLEFLFSPGRTLEQLNPTADPNLQSPILNHRAVDGIFRLGATVLGFMHINEIWKDITGDVLAGWDAIGIDVDSHQAPRAADIISNQMVSFSFAPEIGDFEHDPEAAEPLLLSLSYVPALLPAEGLFIAFGGHLERDVEVNDKWTFSAKIRSDAGVAALIGNPFQVTGPFDDSNFAASVGFASKPDEVTSLSYSIPRPTGTRLDIGQLAVSGSLASTGAEARVSMNDSAFVLDGSDNDSFVRKLLGGAPLRLPFSLTLGYGSGRGLICEYSLPSASPTAQGVQNSPLAGDGPVGSELIAATIPLGRRYGPLTILEVALRLSRASSVDGGDKDLFVIEADASFSVTTSAVYFRLDRLGLGFVLDTSKPKDENNLRFFDARLAISPPLGIAV